MTAWLSRVHDAIWPTGPRSSFQCCCLLAVIVSVQPLAGCATPRHPQTVATKVLPTTMYSSQAPPQVRVQIAGPYELKELKEFPGWEQWEDHSSSAEKAGTAITGAAALVILSPFFLIGSVDSLVDSSERKRLKEEIEQFPTHLAKAIEERLMASPAGKSEDLLDIACFATNETNSRCYVVHAQITLTSNGELLYRDIIRVDHRSYSDDIKDPGCPSTADTIFAIADKTIPAMIQTRLPGLPWK